MVNFFVSRFKRNIFSARQHIAYMLSVLYAIAARLSVRPSVTRVNPTKTVEVRIMKFLQYSGGISHDFVILEENGG